MDTTIHCKDGRAMKTIYDMTAGERAQCYPSGIKALIEADEKYLRVWSISATDRSKKEKELAFLKELLKELEEKV